MDYKEMNAIGIVRLMLTDGVISRETASKYFPELRELEDERIRKKLIAYFKHHKIGINIFYGVKGDDVLAWLEKQGEHAKFHDSIQVGDKVTRNQDGVLVNLSQLNRVAKPAEEYNITGIGSKHAEGKLGEMIKNLKPLEQKPADKVEPKFHEKDWVVTSYGKVNQVITVDRDGNGFTLDDGTYFSGSWKDKYRLWTIQDAKDGDILVTKEGERPFIFKGLLDEIHPESPVAYCGIDTEDRFVISGDGWWTNEEIKPSTKEQRDLLEKAMNDAGYIFDFEKKESNKINSYCQAKRKSEQKPIWSKEDENILKGIIYNIQKCLECHPIEQLADIYYKELSWLESIKERILSQSNQEWGENDETAINDIMWIIEAYRANGFNETHKQRANNAERWLKSLRPQNSITDEELIQARNNAYNDALDKLEYHSDTPTFNDGWSAAIEYLKKRNTQPQNIWKPSDKQLKALEYIIDNTDCGSRYYGGTIKGLLEQLKKLRKE